MASFLKSLLNVPKNMLLKFLPNLQLKSTMLYNVPMALWRLFLALIYSNALYNNYFVNLFYFADVALNALLGGSWRVTISARTGLYASELKHSNHTTRPLWRWCQSVINFTFFPMDGYDHCRQAYEWTLKEVLDHQSDVVRADVYHGPKWAVLFLAVAVTFLCVVFLIIPMRIAGVLKLFDDRTRLLDPRYFDRMDADLPVPALNAKTLRPPTSSKG